MRTFLLPLLAAASLFFGTLASAQNKTDSDKDNQVSSSSRIAIWRCETPGGTYSVAVRAMNAVSISTYIVDGTVRVTEVNIDTTGVLLPRFYYLEPVSAESPFGIGQATLDKAREIVEEVADRSGQSEIWTQVVKNYPGSTHAHTVEYRVDTPEALQNIYRSADNSFRQQKPGKVKLE